VPLYILDTTVLSNFSHIRRLDLIPSALAGGVATSPMVWRELEIGRDLGLVPASEWNAIAILQLSEDEQSVAASLRQVVDAGEAECVALAQTRGASLCTDDLAARRLAQGLGLRLSGTLGILLRLVERGELSLEEGERLLAEMRQYGYRSPVDSLRELL
jgi:predicted nucleic acid-binding protein